MAAGWIFACSSFGSEGDPPIEEEAGLPDRVAPDAPAPIAEQFGDITYDRHDDFERDAGLLADGDFAWTEVATNTEVDNVIGPGDCSDPKCSPTQAIGVANDEKGAGYLATKLSGNTRNLRLDFSMKVSPNDPDAGQARVAAIELEGDRFIYLKVAGDQLFLGDVAPTAPAASTPIGTVTLDQWARYRLYVNLDDRVAALSRDGVRFETVLTIRPEVVKPALRVRLGLTAAGGTVYVVFYDDVGLRELPKP